MKKHAANDMRNSAARLWQIYENSQASRIDGGTLRHLAG